MELQAWISDWQKGEIDAEEPGMQMRASKSAAFSKPLCKPKSPLRTETA